MTEFKTATKRWSYTSRTFFAIFAILGSAALLCSENMDENLVSVGLIDRPDDSNPSLDQGLQELSQTEQALHQVFLVTSAAQTAEAEKDLEMVAEDPNFVEDVEDIFGPAAPAPSAEEEASTRPSGTWRYTCDENQRWYNEYAADFAPFSLDIWLEVDFDNSTFRWYHYLTYSAAGCVHEDTDQGSGSIVNENLLIGTEDASSTSTCGKNTAWTGSLFGVLADDFQTADVCEGLLPELEGQIISSGGAALYTSCKIAADSTIYPCVHSGP